MRLRAIHTVRAAGFVLAVVVCAPAGAQQVPQGSRPGRPYQGVFGQDTGSWSQELTANLSLGGGWDDDLLAGARGGNVSQGEQVSGPFASGSGSLSYGLRQGRFNLGASAGTSVRFYGNQVSRPYLGSYVGGVQASFQFSESTSLSASQSVAYQPFDGRGLFAIDDLSGAAGPEPSDLGATSGSDDYLSASTSVSLSQQVTERSSLQFAYHYRRSDYSGSEQRLQGGRARYSLQLTRDLGLRLGYGYQVRDRTYTSASPDSAETDRLSRSVIDAGIDYNRSFSISRRTTLSFGTGATAVDDVDKTRYRLTGNVDLNREIGRSWSASVAYGRSVQFVDILDSARLSDNVTVRLGGLINRRLSFQSLAGASFGKVGFGGGDNRSDVYRASAGLTAALNRYTGVGVTYAYYRHDFGNDVVLPGSVPPQRERQVVQAYITFWAPLYRRAGRLDAAR